MLGGSGLAVGSADGDGEGLGEALFLPLKSPACADGVVVATPTVQPMATSTRSANRFKRDVL